MGGRMERIESLLVEEISKALLRDIKNPRVGLVTVTEAKVSKDLSVAKVYVSIMGAPEHRKETLEALQHSAGYLQGLFGKRLRLRRIPRIQFIEDESLRQADRITRLLRGETPEE